MDTCQALLEDLTPRERQVLLLLMAELTQNEIAHELGITGKSVHTYKTNAMRKLDVSSNVGLVRRAIACGL